MKRRLLTGLDKRRLKDFLFENSHFVRFICIAKSVPGLIWNKILINIYLPKVVHGRLSIRLL